MRTMTIATLLLSVSFFATPTFAHEGDFIIGRTPANQLAVEFDDDEAYELPQVTLIPGDGWGADDPGFAALDVDEPAEDFYMMSPAAQVAIELISIDADFVMWDVPPAAQVLANPGDQWDFPTGNSFDTHGFWFVDDPDSSELGEIFAMTFKMIDRSGTYTDSPAYTATFTPVPEPTALTLMLLGVAVLRRTRA